MGHVLGHVDDDGAGPTAPCQVKRAADQLRDALDVFDPQQLLHRRAQDIHLPPLLRHVLARVQAVGVADPRMAPVVAGVFAERGNSALVFRGDDGLDELTVTATSRVWVVRDGKVSEEVFDPRDVGIELVPVEALRGADAAYNAEVARRVLDGERGAVRDAVLLNSAAALVALEPADAPLTEQLRDRMAKAAESIDSGAAKRTLERWVAVSNA